MKKVLFLFLCMTTVLIAPAFSQLIFDEPLGDFTHQASFGDDWSEPAFNSFKNGTYEILASGNDIWGNADGFYFVYKEFTGSFIMTADVVWGDQDTPGGPPTAGNAWKKMGLMARVSVDDAGSRHAFAMLRNDLGADLQFRAETGGSSGENPGLTAKGGGDTDTIQLFRAGDTFIMFRGTSDGGFRKIGETVLPDMPDTLFVGLAVTAHDANALERAFFSNVSIQQISVSVSANRTLAAQTVQMGESTKVELTVEVEEGKTADVTLIENPPAGVEVSNISASSGNATRNAQGQIEWTLSKASGTQTLSYEVKTSARPGVLRFGGNIDVAGEYSIGVGGDFLLGAAKPPTGKTVFMFRRIADDTESDKLIMLDLQIYFGVAIQEFDDTNAAGFEMPDTLEGADMAYSSETLLSGNYRDMGYHEFDAVPQITGEQALHDDFAFQAGTGNGSRSDNRLQIVDNEHPITKGFDLGILQVSNGNHDMGRLDNPPEGVRVLAVDPDNPNHARLWVIEKGTTVNGVEAPDMRIATWFQGDNAYADLTDEGKQLIFNVFAYALGEEPPIITAIHDFMLY